MQKIIEFTSVSLLLLFFLTQMSCYPILEKEAMRPEHALKQVHFFYPSFKDDSNFDSLRLAIERNLTYLERLNPSYAFKYGKDEFSVTEVIESQKFFLSLIKKNSDPSQLKKDIKKHFRVYKATGRAGDSNVLFTGYFEPIFEGRLVQDDVYKYPIYAKPDDLLSINLSLFSNKYKGQRIFARIEGKEVIPYFSRYQIEMEKALKGRNLEIAWLKDPVDIAFLHIQGSGRIKLPDGTSICVGYAAKNGRPYHSIGKYLIDKGYISWEQMSMQAIRKALGDNPEIVEEVLNQNQSYVFFRILDDLPIGSINIPVTPGRTIALDRNLFPRGGLGFIVCQKPIIDDEGNILEWIEFSRFVLNQDTGGAIKGAGRADIFWGKGLYAEIAAGHMKHEGELYILVKKPER